MDLIIGKAVRDAEGQRYVREAGRDVVYVIEIDPAKLSTSFEDWIEKDLLKLERLGPASKSRSKTTRPRWVAGDESGGPADDRRGVGSARRYDAGYSDSGRQVDAGQAAEVRSQEGRDGEYVDFTLAEDEELNAETLNALEDRARRFEDRRCQAQAARAERRTSRRARIS